MKDINNDKHKLLSPKLENSIELRKNGPKISNLYYNINPNLDPQNRLKKVKYFVKNKIINLINKKQPKYLFNDRLKPFNKIINDVKLISDRYLGNEDYDSDNSLRDLIEGQSFFTTGLKLNNIYSNIYNKKNSSSLNNNIITALKKRNKNLNEIKECNIQNLHQVFVNLDKNYYNLENNKINSERAKSNNQHLSRIVLLKTKNLIKNSSFIDKCAKDVYNVNTDSFSGISVNNDSKNTIITNSQNNLNSFNSINSSLQYGLGTKNSCVLPKIYSRNLDDNLGSVNEEQKKEIKKQINTNIKKYMELNLKRNKVMKFSKGNISLY